MQWLAFIYPSNLEDKDAYTNEEAEMLDKMALEKIKISDAISVVNINNYIGESTKKYQLLVENWYFYI